MEIPLIINVLNSLTSHDPSVRVPAERFITENELTSSFLPKLLEISLLRRVCYYQSPSFTSYHIPYTHLYIHMLMNDIGG